MLIDLCFQMFLDVIGEFHPCPGEELYAIVMKGVMGSGDDHPGGEFLLPNKASDAGSGDYSGREKLDSVVGKPCGKLSGDVRAGFTRVHPDEHSRLRLNLKQIFSQCASDTIE